MKVGLALSSRFLKEFLVDASVCEVFGYDISSGFLLRLSIGGAISRGVDLVRSMNIGQHG